MDLLSKRYANPCFFMDGMIQTGRFGEFVVEFVKTITQEQQDETDWEFFLHKVWEGSFKDFKEETRNSKEHQNMTDGQIETTVQHSMKILNNFNPERGET